jgi:hypothetical protein
MNHTHLDLLHKVALFKLLKKLTQQTQKCILFSHMILTWRSIEWRNVNMTPKCIARRAMQFYKRNFWYYFSRRTHYIRSSKGNYYTIILRSLFYPLYLWKNKRTATIWLEYQYWPELLQSICLLASPITKATECNLDDIFELIFLVK